MKLQNTHDVGIYCRLSRDDNTGSLESMSIANQKQMLTDYVNEKGWSLKEVYVDDGYSGTNFERPDFKRLLHDIGTKKINCVITKDLSRLGRNYSKVGYYTEEYFIEKGVRFIAVNDGFDTMREEENEIAPFKNVLNEWYPRDISKKVRQVKKSAARQGKYMGSHAPYGYRKSPEDKHVLLVDETAAENVRRIFREFVGGDCARMIAERLNGEGLDCPRFYGAKHACGQKPKMSEHNSWSDSTILQMLHNQVFIGNMAQGKRQVISYKSKKRRMVDPENWIIVEGTHEAIIERETWDRTHAKLRGKNHRARRLNKNGELSLFAGLLRCADCGSSLVYTTKPRKDGEIGIYRCTHYVSCGKIACTPHYTPESMISTFILNDIRLHARMVYEEREGMTQQLLGAMSHSYSHEMRILEGEKREIEGRQLAISSNIKSLYEDKCLGKLPESIFGNLLTDFVREQATLDEKLPVLRHQIDTMTCNGADVKKWLDLIVQYQNIVQLDRTILMELIESITIGEGDRTTGKRTQDVTIRYRFIGDLGDTATAVTTFTEAKKDIA